MPSSRTFSFDDPEACQTIFPSADVELFPTGRGRFRAEISQIGLAGMWLHRIHVSLPEINTVATRPGRVSIGFLTERNSSCLLNGGKDVQPGDIVINGPDIVHQRSGADFHFGTVSVASDRVAAAAEAIDCELPQVSHKSAIRPPSALMLRLLHLHREVARLAHESPECLELPEVSASFENALAHILARCLEVGHSVEPKPGSRRHDVVFERFVDFLHENPDRPLYLAEICAAIGAPERTLRASCEQHLGMGPIRYLTLRRMHLVRRALARSDPAMETVTRIVTRHGFWELGRFAVAYRTLFGESPSETLRQSAYRARLQPGRFSRLAVSQL